MKKGILTCILAGAIVVNLGGVGAFSASAASANRYVDLNNDGICDNRAAGAVCLRDGTGIQCGPSCGLQGANFKDEDGDGICDNIGTQPGSAKHIRRCRAGNINQ